MEAEVEGYEASHRSARSFMGVPHREHRSTSTLNTRFMSSAQGRQPQRLPPLSASGSAPSAPAAAAAAGTMNGLSLLADICGLARMLLQCS